MSYVTTKMLDLDLKKMNKSCHKMYLFIKENFTPDGKTDYSGQSTMTTKLYSQYNLMMYPQPEFHELFLEIQKYFHELANPTEPHYAQFWLNFYTNGEYIDWHHHWPMSYKAWHGFYCVNSENPESKTTYRVPPANGMQIKNPEKHEEVEIISKNNLLVISPSAGDQHRSWPWEGNGEPRITIAFDIVPRSQFNKESNPATKQKNHWIPI